MLSNYNGWTGADRIRAMANYRKACGRDTFRPGPCEMCGQTHGTMMHSEEYGPTLADLLSSSHSLCGRCHAMLHMRFRFPGRWAAYRKLVRRGPQPPVMSIMEVYAKARAWRDTDEVFDPPVLEWWDRLLVVRYRGAQKRLAL